MDEKRVGVMLRLLPEMVRTAEARVKATGVRRSVLLRILIEYALENMTTAAIKERARIIRKGSL